MIPSRNTVFESLPPAIQSLVEKYPSIVSYSLQWGEMDMFGHLNNVQFAKYAESGRVAHGHQHLSKYLEETEFASFLTGKGAGPILASQLIKFVSQIKFPDNIIAATRFKPGSLSLDRFEMETILVSQMNERVCGVVVSTIVAFDYLLQTKISVPQTWIDAFEAESLDKNPS